MNFTATLRGVSFTDPKEFAASVKAAEHLPKSWQLPAKPEPLFVKPRVILTAAEREWLGATVRRSDGAVGQVWALATRGYVWVVADGESWFQVHTDALELVQSRVDQLALEV